MAFCADCNNDCLITRPTTNIALISNKTKGEPKKLIDGFLRNLSRMSSDLYKLNQFKSLEGEAPDQYEMADTDMGLKKLSFSYLCLFGKERELFRSISHGS